MSKQDKLKLKRWIHALEIACFCMEDEGYKTDYLTEIKNFIKEAHHGKN